MTTEFVRDAWGVDGRHDLDHNGSHAWLGYEGVAVGSYLRAFPDDAAIRSRGRASFRALDRRTVGRPIHAIETCPGETYPPDLAMVGAALAPLGPDRAVSVRFLDRWEAASVDPDTGLVRQALDPHTGAVRDGGRGSGTALAASGSSTRIAAPDSGPAPGRTSSSARSDSQRCARCQPAPRTAWTSTAGLCSLGSRCRPPGSRWAPPAFKATTARSWRSTAPRGCSARRVTWPTSGGGALGDAILLAMESAPPRTAP